MKFKAKAIDKNKKQVEIEIDAEDRKSALSELKNRGLLPLELTEILDNSEIEKAPIDTNQDKVDLELNSEINAKFETDEKGEKVFFRQGDIFVTKSRFIVSGQTYVISNITSVKSGVINSSDGCLQFFLGLIGLCFLLGSGVLLKTIGLGIFALVFFLFTIEIDKPKYSVSLNTSGGEIKALVSEDKACIDGVITALNDAIVSNS